MMDYATMLLMACGGTQEVPVDGSTGVWLKEGATVISSGMRMTGVAVTSGQSQRIYNRGVTVSNQISSAALAFISSGGNANDMVLAGGTAEIHVGGTATRVVVNGGRLNCYGNLAGLSAAAGLVFIYSSSTVTEEFVFDQNASGYISTSISGAIVSGTAKAFLQTGASLSGGSAVGNDTVGGVIIYCYNGVLARDIGVFSSAQLRVSSGGSAENVSGAKGNVVVYDGGSAYNITVGGEVSSGGIVVSAVVSNGEELRIRGGWISAVTVESDGVLRVSSGGTALAVTSNAGATVTVAAGGYIEYA